jgi:hypothetical protein
MCVFTLDLVEITIFKSVNKFNCTKIHNTTIINSQTSSSQFKIKIPVLSIILILQVIIHHAVAFLRLATLDLLQYEILVLHVIVTLVGFG